LSTPTKKTAPSAEPAPRCGHALSVFWLCLFVCYAQTHRLLAQHLLMPVRVLVCRGRRRMGLIPQHTDSIQQALKRPGTQPGEELLLGLHHDLIGARQRPVPRSSQKQRDRTLVVGYRCARDQAPRFQRLDGFPRGLRRDPQLPGEFGGAHGLVVPDQAQGRVLRGRQVLMSQCRFKRCIHPLVQLQHLKKSSGRCDWGDGRRRHG